MRSVIPDGFRFEKLTKSHPRKSFRSGQAEVDDWITTKALQNQEKHLSATTVLLGRTGSISGYFTLATGQVDFGDLPMVIAKKLPRRMLPTAVLGWLGVAESHQRQGLGRLLLARALRDCHRAGQTFAFVSVILDCVDERAKTFYQQFDFAELPGHPYRLFLSTAGLDELMAVI